MMNKKTFANNVLNAIKVKLGDYYKVTLNPVTKNNGLNLLGLLIQKHNNAICPNIYLDDYYKQSLRGRSFEDIVEDILETYANSMMNTNLSLDWLQDKESFLSKVAYKLVNRDLNENLLESVPYIPIVGDLVKVFYLTVTMGEESGTILIHNGLMENAGVTLEELDTSANINTPALYPFEFETMENVLSGFLSNNESKGNPLGMYVLSNVQKVFGASTLCYKGLLDKICEKLKSSIYIIPSSIHELIILSSEHCESVPFLNALIRETNTTHVSQDELLSNHLYYYNKDIHSLSVA